MEEELKYTSEFDGQTTDEVLEHAKSVKDLTIPSLSNISGFVCIDNEGKAIGMMSKEQVAQVVGGLLNPFLIKQTLQSGVDLNTITEIGLYRLNGLCTNAPFSQSWGTLIVIPNNSSKPSQIVTLLTSDSFGIFARKEVNMAWYKINTSAV